MRLFDRGHREEARFVEFMQMTGMKIQEFDPATVDHLMYHPESDSYFKVTGELRKEHFGGGLVEELTPDTSNYSSHVLRAQHEFKVVLDAPKQFRFESVEGHVGGSLDGEAWNVPFLEEELGLPSDTTILTEFKTHGVASYEKLVAADSVRMVKPEHYTQMVLYMEHRRLPAALYAAVNKNTDDLYFEFISADPEHAAETMDKARRIVYAKTPPKRISRSPSHFTCKFCDHRDKCHFGAPLTKNCRSCEFSAPVAEGKWYCGKWNATIPVEVEAVGCDGWKQIND